MKPTIYRIIKRTNKKLVVNRDKTSVEISHWYIAKRKGCIFGFWHIVGHESDGWDGNMETAKNYIEGLKNNN